MLLGDGFLLCPDEMYNAQQFVIIPFLFICLRLFFFIPYFGTGSDLFITLSSGGYSSQLCLID